MARVFVGIGSNEGDRLATISQAVQALASLAEVRVMQMALIMETDPVGGPPQGRYLNTVVELDTSLVPSALLGQLKTIEARLGRQPATQRWAPRPIDLDILLYDAHILQDPVLTIPHPRLHERRFVLEPLAQLAPEMLHPVARKTIKQLLAECPLP